MFLVFVAPRRSQVQSRVLHARLGTVGNTVVHVITVVWIAYAIVMSMFPNDKEVDKGVMNFHRGDKRWECGFSPLRTTLSTATRCFQGARPQHRRYRWNTERGRLLRQHRCKRVTRSNKRACNLTALLFLRCHDAALNILCPVDNASKR